MARPSPLWIPGRGRAIPDPDDPPPTVGGSPWDDFAIC